MVMVMVMPLAIESARNRNLQGHDFLDVLTVGKLKMDMREGSIGPIVRTLALFQDKESTYAEGEERRVEERVSETVDGRVLGMHTFQDVTA